MTTRILLVLLGLGLALSPTTIASNTFQVPHRWGQNQHRIMVQAEANFQSVQKYLSWLRQNDYDVAGVLWKQAQIEVITDDAGLEKLTQYRMNYQVIKTKKMGQVDVSDSRAQKTQNNRAGTTEGIDKRYLDPQKVEAKLKQIATQFPQFTRLEQIGTSNQGRAIWALLLSTTPQKNDPNYYNKPTVLFDGMHHAREIMTTEIVMDIADVVLTMKRANSPWNQLIDNWNIWLVPMLNVDGNNIVWSQDNWWRKNARANDSKVFGVDINRNYPFKWKACNGSSGSPSSDSYRGDNPGSEPETQALAKLGYMANPTGYLSYHSYSELVLYPFGCNGSLTAENVLHQKVGNELAKMLPTDDNRGTYTPGSPWQILYSVDGDSMSFMHSEFGALSFTFEVNQSFQPGYETREPTLIKHRKAWAYFIQRMNQNLFSLKVTVGNQPVDAIIGISTINKIQGEKPFRTNANGSFFKVLDPGIYTITVQLKDGRRQQIQVEMKGTPQAQLIQF